MNRLSAAAWVTLLASSLPAFADSDAPSSQPAESTGSAQTQPAESSEKPADAKSAEPPSFRLDYSGDFLTSPALTGDWGGLRSKLANDGISFNIETLQYGQGNAHGGRSTNDATMWRSSTA